MKNMRNKLTDMRNKVTYIRRQVDCLRVWEYKNNETLQLQGKHLLNLLYMTNTLLCIFEGKKRCSLSVFTQFQDTSFFLMASGP